MSGVATSDPLERLLLDTCPPAALAPSAVVTQARPPRSMFDTSGTNALTDWMTASMFHAMSS